MNSLRLAYVDTSIWITRIEGHPAYRKIVEDYLEQLQHEGWRLCASQAVQMELFYKPYRNNNQSLIAIYMELFQSTKILPCYTHLLKDGLRIMKEETLKAMDAIHVALALQHGCTKFISTDTDFRALQCIPVHWIDLTKVS